MKKMLLFVFTSIFLFSCQKQKQTSIIGGWLEVSVYREGSGGQYNWEPASRFPLKLWFDVDGKYAAFNDVPAGKGSYFFDYSTKALKFESLNPVSTETYSVSYLDDSYLTIDYNTNYRIKFVRL